MWRMYEYVDDAERQTILTLREEKRDFLLGQGGEGYIAPEDWCYNCGECGHLGDVRISPSLWAFKTANIRSHGQDCTQQFPHDHLKEPSAFSEHNCLAGPFFDAQHPVKRAPGRAATYARQTEEAWGDGDGHLVPLDVGKKGRRKERTRLEQKAQQSRGDDEDDWFARRGDGGGAGSGGGRSGPGGRSLLARLGEPEREPRKMTFGLVAPGGRRSWYDQLPPPMLASESLQIRGASRRDDWDGAIRGASSRNVGGRGRPDRDFEREYERERDRDHNRSYGRDRKNDSRYRDRRSPERRRDREASPRREPRYRGGYAR